MTDLETVLTPIRERDEGNDHSYPSWETAWSDRHTLLRLSKWIGHDDECKKRTIWVQACIDCREGERLPAISEIHWKHCTCGLDNELRAIGEE